MDLEKVAPILEQIIKESLEEKRYMFGFGKYQGTSNKVASGKLKNSVTVTSSQNAGVSELQVMMEEYSQWVQSGRLPGKKFIPVGEIEKWIKERGLKGRDKTGKFITNRSFAFAITRNINKFGIRPSNFIDVSLEKIMDDPRIVELIGEASYEELINAITGI
jgi:hypothetical protein